MYFILYNHCSDPKLVVPPVPSVSMECLPQHEEHKLTNKITDKVNLDMETAIREEETFIQDSATTGTESFKENILEESCSNHNCLEETDNEADGEEETN